MADVIVIGGGVIGLTTAWELAGRGAAVKVLEQGRFGCEASWAAAGMLPPGNPAGATTPKTRLRAESHVLWPDLSAQLAEETGIDNGYRREGGLELRFAGREDGLAGEIEDWRAERVEVEALTPERLRVLEPNLNHSVASGYFLPGFAQVRNPRHLKALVAGCAKRGVELVTGAAVTDFDWRGNRAVSVKTPTEEHEADCFCIAGGARSQALLERAGCRVHIEPVRGQIVLLSTQRLPIRHGMLIGKQYLVPRPDGRILVGSTEEWTGFDKSNTAQAVAELLQFATSLVPVLAEARLERTWAGLRPGSHDGLPYLGPVPGTGNVFAAAGHFRSGLQMSPATAVLMRQTILGEESYLPPEPYACDRYRRDSCEPSGHIV